MRKTSPIIIFQYLSITIKLSWVLCISSQVSSTLSTSVELEKKLTDIKDSILNKNDTCKRVRQIDGIIDFWSQSFANYTDGLPIYVKVVESHLPINRFGNYFGVVINDYACARVSKAHFILIRCQGSRFERRKVDVRESILWYLPTLSIHPNPERNISNSIEISRKNCLGLPYPWQYGGTALLTADSAKTARNIIHSSITSLAEYLHQRGLLHDSRSILISNGKYNDSNTTYPLVADVALHYRCSNNIDHPNYGLLPFPIVLSLIPSHTNVIHVHTEGSAGSSGEHICSHIIRALYSDLTTAFPNATVTVFSKASIYATMLDFIYSKQALICSSSTFCFHVALGKKIGAVYVPPNWYNKTFNFGYDDWHYFNFSPRWRWPRDASNTTTDRVYILNALHNLTEYFSV